MTNFAISSGLIFSSGPVCNNQFVSNMVSATRRLFAACVTASSKIGDIDIKGCCVSAASLDSISQSWSGNIAPAASSTGNNCHISSSRKTPACDAPRSIIFIRFAARSASSLLVNPLMRVISSGLAIASNIAIFGAKPFSLNRTPDADAALLISSAISSAYRGNINAPLPSAISAFIAATIRAKRCGDVSASIARHAIAVVSAVASPSSWASASCGSLSNGPAFRHNLLT